MLLTGTDEHGQKVQRAAEAAGIAPIELCDTQAARFKSLFGSLQTTEDRFIRTTEAAHQVTVHSVWEALCAAGHIYKGAHQGWYSVSDEAYYTEMQVRKEEASSAVPAGGEVPHPQAAGMVSIETGSPVSWVSEENYMFRLSAFQQPLLAWLDAHSDAVMPPSRHAEVRSFVEGGLRDLSVSRARTAVSWGIPVPGDEEHVIYVWLDALTNYLTACGHPEAEEITYAAPGMWPAKFQVVGKDILRFHAVYWPAFLMALGLPLPQHIVAHGWWTREGKKMSKSIGNVVDPSVLVETYGSDQVRFYLCRESNYSTYVHIW